MNTLAAMTNSVSLSQLAAISVTTFICTFAGLYFHHYLTSNHYINNETNKQEKESIDKKMKQEIIPKSKSKATEFWDNYHCDESVTTEWFVCY